IEANAADTERRAGAESANRDLQILRIVLPIEHDHAWHLREALGKIDAQFGITNRLAVNQVDRSWHVEQESLRAGCRDYDRIEWLRFGCRRWWWRGSLRKRATGKHRCERQRTGTGQGAATRRALPMVVHGRLLGLFCLRRESGGFRENHVTR